MIKFRKINFNFSENNQLYRLKKTTEVTLIQTTYKYTFSIEKALILEL
jgi:hypothetical protein